MQWQFTEEKKEYSKDKELLVILIGAAAAILAILAKTYIFSALLILATVTLVHIHRKKPRTMIFAVTDIGLFLDDDFVELEHIKGFNIIDDPGKTARLILKVERIIHMNEIIPIYDVNMEDIERVLRELNIEKDELLEPTVMDHLASILI